jgi:hypothetical protein
MIIFLYILAPLLALIYKVFDYLGIYDTFTKRKQALIGFDRLNSTKGFPVSWIYNDDQDKNIFEPLFKRIIKNTKSEELKKLIKEGLQKPKLIVTVGNPIFIEGIVLNGNKMKNHFILKIILYVLCLTLKGPVIQKVQL